MALHLSELALHGALLGRGPAGAFFVGAYSGAGLAVDGCRLMHVLASGPSVPLQTRAARRGSLEHMSDALLSFPFSIFIPRQLDLFDLSKRIVIPEQSFHPCILLPWKLRITPFGGKPPISIIRD